ncbi:MAG: iron ABC transporter permease [Thermoleophilaceae bacterium]
MGVASGAPAAAPPARRRLPRFDGWAAAGMVVALLVAAPLLVLPGAFLDPRVDVWWGVTGGILPEVLLNTALVGGGVGAGTFVLGTSLALLVSFYEFPGRRVLDWALILPLALPAYVMTFVYLGQAGFDLPLRTTGGAVAILTLALYPYVYLLARAAFRGQSGNVIEAARSLGAGRLSAIVRVALPMARPALAAGTLLAVMEALADFGSVQLLGVKTFTVAIYQVWFGAFDRLAATQLATLLMGLTLALFALERLARGRSRFEQQAGRAAGVARVRLHGPRAWLAAAFPTAVLAVAFVDPVAQLVVWSFSSLDEPLVRSGFGTWARNSIVLAVVAALVAVPVAMTLVYGLRVAPSRVGRAATRVASVGYGVPGSVVAVAALVSLAWVDHRLQDAGALVGISLGLLLTGTALGLVFAYVVRFLALAFQSLESQMARLSPNLDAAARSLGADRLEVMWRVHMPLMRVGLLVAGLLVFVETMKELPATVLLRPFGGDTLAVAVWQSTTESLWEAAALPALAIVAVGLLPVVLLMRVLDRTGRRDLVGG